MPAYSFQLSAHLAGRAVSVVAAGSSTVVASGTLDGSAKFAADLPVGDYVAAAGDGHYAYQAAGTVDQGDSDRLVDLSSTYAALSVSGQEALRTQNDAAMRIIRAALAGSVRGKNKATIAVLGDSKSEGENSDAGATYQDVWTRYLLAALRRRWQPAGVAGGDGFIPAKYAYANPTGQGFTFTGTSPTDYSVSNTFGPGARNVQLKTTAGAMSITKTFTSIDVYYYNVSAATKFDVTIDGVTTTVTTNSTGSNQKWSSGALASGSHTVTIKYATGSSAVAQITGVDFFNGDENAGVRLMDASHYGWTTAAPLSILGNHVPAINLASPDLVIVKLGTNDYPGVTPAAFQANLLQIMSTHSYSFVNRLTKVPSYLIVVPEARATMAAPIGDYVAAAYAVAAAMPVPTAVLDLSLRMPASSASSTLGLWSADGLHENSRGHQYVADAVERVIVG